MVPDFEKQQLLNAWLETQHAFRLHFACREEPIDAISILQQISNHHQSTLHLEGEYIYLLCEDTTLPVPRYIGRAKDPLKRWKGHLKAFQKGEKNYALWQAQLLSDSQARMNLVLYVIPVAQVTAPPIPGFPVTVGALEYQLISLAEDAFETPLLNFEGKKR